MLVRLLLATILALLAPACAREEEPEPQPLREEDVSRRGRLLARPDAEPLGRDAPAGVQRLGQARLYVPRSYSADTAHRLVVVLHGAGGSADDALALLRPYADDGGFLLLAPQSEAQTWDVLRQGYGPDVARLDALLRRVFTRYSIGDVAVGGFSDGASYAVSLGMINGDLFDAVIAFSPGFASAGERRGKPDFFVSHGTQDTVLPIDRTSRLLVPELRDLGYDVEYREFDGPHTVPRAIREAAIEWLLS